MQAEVSREEWRLENRDILEVNAELDGACAMAIVRQARRSLRDGSAAVVIDLSNIEGLSIMGLATLVDRANKAGVLPHLVFRVKDPLVRRLLSACMTFGTDEC